MGKKCKDCKEKEATWNFPNEKIFLYCGKCKKDGMINLKGKKCEICQDKFATYNYPYLKKAFCKGCSTDGMIDVLDNKCIVCKTIRANFNYTNEKKALYCESCSLDNMVNIKASKCIKCKNNQPSFNYPNKKKYLYCSNCALDDMINIRTPKCILCNDITPVFNYPNETIPLYCYICSKTFKDPMVNVISPKCILCNLIRPSYNVSNQKTPLYCYKCSKTFKHMVDVISPRCKNEFCDTLVKKKYKGYCTHCFSNLFPNDPLTFQIHSKSKEIIIRDFINANFTDFIHDKSIFTNHCNCTIRRRIDHRKLINNTLLVIETDENQHKSYNQMDEEIRYDDLYMGFSGKWIYIRFNPDSYKSLNGKTTNPQLATRLSELKNEIKYQIERIKNEENDDLLEIKYMYYDDYT
jgi:hypothetical protein